MTSTTKKRRRPGPPITNFYPMRFGEVIDERYQIAAKLGWGARSTVWLAKDLKRWRWQADRYVAIKVSVASNDWAAEPELANLRVVGKASRSHHGRAHVRSLLDAFGVHSPAGEHLCMVFEPLRDALLSLGRRFTTAQIPTDILPLLAKPLLQALDFLHTECKLIHTDLKPDNVMTAFTPSEVRQLIPLHEEQERTTPRPQKQLEGRTIYLPHNDFGPARDGIGRAFITDFDPSMRGNVDTAWSHEIQAHGLQAPEVVVGAPWSYSVDMWKLGTLLLYLIESRDIFRNEEGKTDISRMVACLGRPPQALVKRSVRPTAVVDEDGQLRVKEVQDDVSLERFVTRMEGAEKAAFLGFGRRVLKWMPEDRATAKESLDDPWLEMGYRGT